MLSDFVAVLQNWFCPDVSNAAQTYLQSLEARVAALEAAAKPTLAPD